MAKLSQLAAARKSLKTSALLRCLIYGDPKTGKTRLAGTIARVPHIKRVLWLDLENGSETLLGEELGLTPEQMDKIEVISLPDTANNPVGIETLLKLADLKPHYVCYEHGRAECPECTPKLSPSQRIKQSKEGLQPLEGNDIVDLGSLGANDVLVVDTLSQLGSSALEVALRLTKNDDNAYAKYVELARLLSDFLSVVQQLKTNVVCTTHVTTQKDKATGKEKIVPLCGSRNYSLLVAKYFSTVIYLTVDTKKFKAGSSPDYKLSAVAGDRLGKKIEDAKSITLEHMF